jgi:hypothetical protein
MSESNEVKYPSLFWPNKYTHALAEEKGEIMASPGRNKWVIVKLDSFTSYPPQSIECLQIGQGFLALQRVNLGRTGPEGSGSVEKAIYRRVGGGFISRCLDFFDDAEKQEVTLI